MTARTWHCDKKLASSPRREQIEEHEPIAVVIEKRPQTCVVRLLPHRALVRAGKRDADVREPFDQSRQRRQQELDAFLRREACRIADTGANLYIEGAPTAFAEDGWSRVRIGTVELAGLGPVSRCVMTTLDEHTLARGKEPIRTLARHRRWDGQTWMSLGLRTITPGTLRLGDRVEVLD